MFANMEAIRSTPSYQRASTQPRQEGSGIAGRRAEDARHYGYCREPPPQALGHSLVLILYRSASLRIADAKKYDRRRRKCEGDKGYGRRGHARAACSLVGSPFDRMPFASR